MNSTLHPNLAESDNEIARQRIDDALRGKVSSTSLAEAKARAESQVRRGACVTFAVHHAVAWAMNGELIDDFPAWTTPERPDDYTDESYAREQCAAEGVQ